MLGEGAALDPVEQGDAAMAEIEQMAGGALDSPGMSAERKPKEAKAALLNR